MKTVFSSESAARHQTATDFAKGVPVDNLETGQRVDIILEAIRQGGLGDITECPQYDLTVAHQLHDPGYLRFLETAWDAWEQDGGQGDLRATIWPHRSSRKDFIPASIEGRAGYYGQSTGTAICPGTWTAAVASQSVARHAVQLIRDGERAVFAACRPPGHHATSDQYGGYCFLNNAAIAAQDFLNSGSQRVTILDIDFHHGNGTQQIFYHRGDVQTISIHGDPNLSFPYYLGFEDETGAEEGLGFSTNYVLHDGTSYEEWAQRLDRALERIRRFRPDQLIVSLGFDIFAGDPYSFFDIQSEDFCRIGQTLSELNPPTVFVLEGGYATDALGKNALNFLSTFDAHQKIA